MACFIVTLVDSGTRYKLSDLIANSDNDPDNSVKYTTQGRELHLSAHPDNLGVIMGGEDKDVSQIRYGYILTPDGFPRIYGDFNSAILTTNKFFVADTDNQQMLVELIS